MLGASTNQKKKKIPLGGMNETQCIKWQADIAEAKASYDETISANEIFTHLCEKNRREQRGRRGLCNVDSQHRADSV